MVPAFHINPELDIPIYRQLVDMIQTAIKQGQLAPGEKLPTVQEMAQNLSIARGTIKRAYDELEREGYLEKVQGRGTFVCYRPADSGSRKEQAMAAIDEALNRLEAMGFSPAEIHIFLNLKLRQRAEQEARIKVVLVEETPENMEQMANQLRKMEGVDLYTYLLDSLRQYPYKLGDDFDILVSTEENEEYLRSILPGNKRPARVALGLSPESVTSIVRLPERAQVGIFPGSPRFARMLLQACARFAPELQVRILRKPEELDTVEAILSPKGCERFATAEERELLERYGEKVIPCAFEMDAGSLLYLQTRLRKLLEAKTI